MPPLPEQVTLAAVGGLLRSAVWPMEPRALEQFASAAREPRADRVGTEAKASEARLDGAVAVVPVVGPILPREDEAWWYGGTSSHWLRETFGKLGADPKITAVVVDVDSPGGVITGVPEAAEALFVLRDLKPTVAVSSGMMASAAYWIGSAAAQVVSAPSSLTGSIGVWRAHVDATGFFDQMGLKVTLISAGKYKVEGNMFEALSDETRAQFQAEVDEAYDWFLGDVGRYRGISKAKVRTDYGEGRVYKADKAKASGMVDRIDTLEGVLMRLTKKTAGRTGRAAEREVQIAEAEAGLADDQDAA